MKNVKKLTKLCLTLFFVSALIISGPIGDVTADEAEPMVRIGVVPEKEREAHNRSNGNGNKGLHV